MTTPFARSLRRAALAAATVIPALTLVGCASDGPPAESFDSPQTAVAALVSSLGPPMNHERLDAILGAGGKEITSSGDSVADEKGAENFLRHYKEANRLETEDDGSMELIVGNNQWPMPIPIIKNADGTWSFDAAAGKDEILRRRIGGNENWTMNVLLAIVDAQREYAQRDPDNNGLANYAPRLLSTQGKRDGLYWPTADGERPSPMGELVADAAEDGYRRNDEGRTAFHGYFYKLLSAQGPAAPGGEMSYADKQGLLLNGFGVVAWPAVYGNSGIMTFIVSADGTVYEKDLGDDSASIAAAMNAYNPDHTWKRSDVPTIVPDND